MPLLLALTLVLHPIATNLDQPVQLVSAHDHTGDLFIATQRGLILRLDHATGATSTFLDMRNVVQCCDNGGLLSIVFHPRYMENGQLFVQYVDSNGDTTIARYTHEANPQILFTAAQPKDDVPNHHGGTLQFGPDGMLYISIGDGGAYVKVTNRAQELDHLLGKLLRIDVDHGSPYAIPADNPFVGQPNVRAEIWSYGLRNPWRYSFDRLTGDLFIGDVGQNLWEEVDVRSIAAARGVNFGWPLLEGTHCFLPGVACSLAGYALPAFEYSHAEGCSITGGYRYRGVKYPSLYGFYIYGDYCAGTVWGEAQRGDGVWSRVTLAQTDAYLVSFGEDDDGELYVVDHKGTVYSISADAPGRRRAAQHR